MMSSDAIPQGPEVPKLCRLRQLAEWFGVSERTIMNWAHEGILPMPLQLSPRKRLFRVEEVREHLIKLESERWTLNREDSNGKAK